MSYAQEKVALTSIVLVWRILLSSFVMYNDTLEKFSFVNLKKWKKIYGFLSYHLEHGKILDIRYVKVVK